MRVATGWVGGALAGVLAMGAVCAAGQAPVPPAGEAKTMVSMPPTPLLPTNASLVAPGADFAVPEDSSEVQAILKEDGLTRTESRVTVVPTASKPVASGWVKAYEFVDATGALSAYTYFRDGGKPWEGGERVNATDVISASGDRVYLSGTSVIRARINQHGDSTHGLLSAINVGLPKIGGRKALPPLLPTLFPAEVGGVKIDAATLRYSLGPLQYQAMGGVLPPEILGWDKSAEVETATYAGHGNKGTLTLLWYPTPQIAGDRGRAIEKAINDAGPAKFGTVKMRRVGPLVGVTSGGLSAEQAQKLVEELHLNEVATFDTKMPVDFHVEVRKTVTLLQGIAIFTGVMILAAVVIAVFLGGARAGIRVLRGKSAASDPEFLTIDLRGQPKGLYAPKDDAPGDGGS